MQLFLYDIIYHNIAKHGITNIQVFFQLYVSGSHKLKMKLHIKMLTIERIGHTTMLTTRHLQAIPDPTSHTWSGTQATYQVTCTKK